MITTGNDLYQARLGLGWSAGLMGRALRLGRWWEPHSKTPKERVHGIESGRIPVSGPVAVAVEAFEAGWRPNHINWKDIRDDDLD